MKPVTTILFVENDAVALTMYQKRLQREGFHVETAEDGIAALRVLSEMTPDIVILDLMLPKFSGRDVFDYMRADTQFRKVPVIIFSNAPKTEWPLDMEASPTRALPKSEANFASLLDLIRDMLNAAYGSGAQGVIPAQAPASLTDATPALTAVSTSVPQSEGNVPAPAVPDNLSSPETVEQFLEYVTADMAVLREHCLAFIKGPNTDQGRNNLAALRKRLQPLAAGAQKTNCARLALLANAWDSLLAEIERKPSITSPSILQTLAQAADCLRILLSNGKLSSMEPVPKARVFSVDDDEICNHVAISALEKANMDADSVIDANQALEILKERDFDMILLDINMPVLTGFELCEKLRALPHHQKTPVIFVTAYNNFENRKQSVLSGGGDLIAKPVSPLELALKVTIHLLKAPPKTVLAPKADGKPEPALVWKEPVETISHDSEIRRNAPANGTSGAALPASQPVAAEPAKIPAPKFEASKTEIPKIQPPKVEMPKAEPPKITAQKIEAPKIEPPKIPAPEIEPLTIQLPKTPATRVDASVAKTSKIEAVKTESPKTVNPAPAPAIKSEATKALATALQPATPASAPAAQKPAAKATEPKPVLESVAKPSPLPEKNQVAPIQPSRTTQPAAALSSGSSSKPNKPMTKEINQQFETLVLDVAHIIFGDNAPDINIRLVRMALQQVWQNRANLESIDSVAREIARIIFGEGSASELNTRLVRMALERSNSIALFKAA
jgi:DNA-binding response OmpR family regulator